MKATAPRCCPSDERRQHRLMWQTWIFVLFCIWAWQGFFLVVAVASHVDVPCAVVYMRMRRAMPASDFEVVADFQQPNTTRRTGNVTVLADGNLTEGIAAERDFALGTVHHCVYARNRDRLYYHLDAPPARDLPSLTAHIVAFSLMCVVLVVAILQMRQHTGAHAPPLPRAPDGAPSLIAEHSGPCPFGDGPMDVEMAEMGVPDDDDEEDEVLHFPALPAPTQGAAIVN